MKFGTSWWGRNWLKALEGVDFTNRIPRGKSYANTGKVYDIKIEDNIVYSKVKGRSHDHYKTQIEFRKFTKEQVETIMEVVNESEYIISSLLNHKLPTQLYNKLFERGIQVFPTSIEYITPHCSCPDYAYICKHIAGLLYMISYEVDKNPFLVFKLQGCDLLDLLDFKTTSNNIKHVEELFTNHDNEKNLEPDEVNFAKIPDLMDNIFLLLEEKPLFFEKDFKNILKNIYKSLGHYVKRNVDSYTPFENYGYEPYERLDNSHTHVNYEGSDEELDEWMEEIFLVEWSNPHQWEIFNIDLNSLYEIKSINSNASSLFDEYLCSMALFTFLVELDCTSVDRYNKHIQAIHSIYQFTLELIKKHAIIPELFESKETYHIRWIPAIFDEKISEIINNLSCYIPEDLITFNGKEISKKDQIIVGVSLIIDGFFHKYFKYGVTQANRKFFGENVFRLFFFEAQRFDEFIESGYENLINQWLSKFILQSREYDLFLVVDEDEGHFDVKIQASIEEGIMESIPSLIKNVEDKKVKSQLISDMYLINEISPDVTNKINVNDDLKLDLNEFSNFFINTLPLFEIVGINIILPKNLRKIFKPKLTLDIASTQNQKGYLKFKDIIKFDWKVALGSTDCSLEEFKKLSEKSQGLVKIADEYYILDEDETKSLIKQIEKLPSKLNKHELLKAALSKEINGATVNIDKNISKSLMNLHKQSDLEVPEQLNATLRPYQEVGYSWLVQNMNNGFGSILADDMGLGKTLQVLTCILHLKEEGLLKKAKVLIVAPTSLLTNWQMEINKFTPSITSFIYHGSKRKFPKKEYDVYLTSYGVIRRDSEKFNKKKWFLTVVDEAQNIKNPNTKQSQSIKSIKSSNRIALSGTPVENRLSEYWSIFDFINKGYLTTLKKFKKNYIVPIEKERNTDVLNKFKLITEPFILRRLKSDKNIIKDLPDKITNDIFCSLTKYQTALYKETLDSTMNQINENDGIKRKGIVLKLINSLKEICNHPSHYTKSKKYEVNESGKMEVLMDILGNILDSNEKVLIFTQYVEMGEIMKKLISKTFNEEVLFLHGSLSRKKRDNMVKRFQNNTQTKIFIVSLKAGGTGLNLTAANHVVHYDLWWNPAVENQATDRAYRIGQKDNVMVYRFITTGTFEERINDMIHDKKELAELTVGSGEKFITEMSDNELKEMLKIRNK